MNVTTPEEAKALSLEEWFASMPKATVLDHQTWSKAGARSQGERLKKDAQSVREKGLKDLANVYECKAIYFDLLAKQLKF